MIDVLPSAFLYVPGSDERKLAKLRELDAPAFVIDLEDAVAATEKADARALAAEQLDPVRAETTFVRINGVTTEHALADLDAVVRPGLAGVVVPKVEHPRDVRMVAWALDQLERTRGIAPRRTPVIALIESAQGLHNAARIARAPRVAALCLGYADLSADLGVALDEERPEAAHLVSVLMSQLLLASRHAGIDGPHQGPATDVRDLGRLERTTQLARRLGCTARHVIHPSHVPVVRDVLRVEDGRVAWAESVLRAFEPAERQGHASITIDGEFVDYAVAANARRILSRAGRGTP